MNHHETKLLEIWTQKVLLVRAQKEIRNTFLETRIKVILCYSGRKFSGLCPVVMWETEFVSFEPRY